MEEARLYREGMSMAKGKPGPGKKYSPWLGFRPGLKRRDDMTEIAEGTEGAPMLLAVSKERDDLAVKCALMRSALRQAQCLLRDAKPQDDITYPWTSARQSYYNTLEKLKVKL